MTSSDVYEKICKHLAKMNDIRDIVVSGDDHDQYDRAPGYITALISKRITCLYFAIHAHRGTTHGHFCHSGTRLFTCFIWKQGN